MYESTNIKFQPLLVNPVDWDKGCTVTHQVLLNDIIVAYIVDAQEDGFGVSDQTYNRVFGGRHGASFESCLEFICQRFLYQPLPTP